MAIARGLLSLPGAIPFRPQTASNLPDWGPEEPPQPLRSIPAPAAVAAVRNRRREVLVRSRRGIDLFYARAAERWTRRVLFVLRGRKNLRRRPAAEDGVRL